VWAAIALARDVHFCPSLLAGKPVRAAQLDPVALRRAVRGGPLPSASQYVRVTAEMLDAIAEGGPFA
jgi:hypothetical protein